MANHVDNYISIEHCDSAINLEGLFMHDNEFLEVEQVSFIKPLAEFDEDGVLKDWYNWGCEHIGAKWFTFEDVGEHVVIGTSAWSPVIPFVEKLTEHLAKDDEGVVIRHEYTDEFYNFIGIAKYTFEDGKAVCRWEEIEHSDINEMFMDKYQVDTQHDDFDWWEPIQHEGEELDPLELQSEFIENWREETYAEL